MVAGGEFPRAWIGGRESQLTWRDEDEDGRVLCGFSPFVPSILPSQARGTSRASSSAGGECSDGDGQTCSQSLSGSRNLALTHRRLETLDLTGLDTLCPHDWRATAKGSGRQGHADDSWADELVETSFDPIFPSVTRAHLVENNTTPHQAKAQLKQNIVP